MLVKIGERYWIVIAEAKGMFCSVTKKQKSAVVPNAPRRNSNTLLDPFQSALSLRRPMKQNELATVQRKKTTSIAGILGNSFTRMLAIEKANVDKNIERMPTVRNLLS